MPDKIYQILGTPSGVKGEFGIEIEAEMKNPVNFSHLVETPIAKHWRLEKDGSLKKNGIEFVLRQPIKMSSVPKYIGDLKKELSLHKLPINNSIRAGIHIHYNMSQRTLKDLYKFLCVYYPLETVMVRSAGEGREGNLFCLRARDCPFISMKLISSLKNGMYEIQTDDLRYSALNLQSLFKYGSIEFRALATDPELKNVHTWAKLIKKIDEYSSKIDDVWTIAESVSGFGGEDWVKEVVGDDLFEFLKYPGMDEDVYEDLQEIQMFQKMVSETYCK